MTLASKGLLGNEIFLTTLCSWFVAQGIKVARGIARGKGFNFKWFLESGGMPSAHSATVVCLTTSVGLNRGFSSDLFVITLFYTLIIAFDAAGFRRAVGRQAMALNQIVDVLTHTGKVDPARFRELMGHTPKEVFVGALLGITIAVLGHAL